MARARGIAMELGAVVATVYVFGRMTRGQQSEYGRLETIEETAETIDSLGGKGIAVRVDHLVSEEVLDLVACIRKDEGLLDILVMTYGVARSCLNRTSRCGQQSRQLLTDAEAFHRHVSDHCPSCPAAGDREAGWHAC